jgi:ADP-heptose:LPS heptosyltransferase
VGLGGYLTWTAVARELVHSTGVSKAFPFEQHGNLIKAVKTPIFENNPYILQEFDSNIMAVPMQLNNPHTNYCKEDTPQKAVHRYDKHIIEQICEAYGIRNPKLKCELYFAESEKQEVDDILDQHNIVGDFIVIEPQSNDEYTVNKKYPIEKWQHVANELMRQGHNLVQIGTHTKDQLLDGVIDLTGKTSFRTAAIIISKSRLFVSSEGGLMHAANAVGKDAVILYTGFIHPTMTCYSENINLWIGASHGPCGMKILCRQCLSDSESHDPNQILDAIRKKLT